ncbi:hypothetical protein PHYPO_G00116680 [Pangasianodon hypophthalmus]|uniref:Uncharacterized protein n=1 Tax=Pangasianodon hypophthalmus TaxID=310915 RepID=A0A5N5L3N1_PANHP|nr:hypothetical protein PHYPO_G00116680 [Pangasianodon hypophthalmus]
MLSMSYSESIRSGISRYHSDQGLNQAPRQTTNQTELQRLREQRAAAHVKNMEDFLKMNGLTLEECVSFQTGMKYSLGRCRVSGTAVTRKRFALALVQRHAAIRCQFWVPK